MKDDSNPQGNDDLSLLSHEGLRESWMTLSDLIESTVPKGDNDALLAGLRSILDKEALTTRSMDWSRWWEPAAALSAIAAIVVLAVILANPGAPAPMERLPSPPTEGELAWEDGFEASVAALEQEALTWSYAPSVAVEFVAIHEQMEHIVDEFDSKKL